MAIDRRLESLDFPYIPLRISLRNRSLNVQALLDTGFDGDVALPLGLLLNSGPDRYTLWTLADGSEVVAPAFLGTVELGEFDALPVLVNAIGDEPLIGRGLSDRFLITLDHGRRIIVEP